MVQCGDLCVAREMLMVVGHNNDDGRRRRSVVAMGQTSIHWFDYGDVVLACCLWL